MLADILMRYDIEVIFTRAGNERVSLDKRVQIANKSNAVLFVSIHLNSATHNKATGTEVFAYSKVAEGNKLAESILKHLVEEIKLPNRGVKYDRLQVVATTKIPACLVEVAFINNPAEEKLLKNIEFLERAAVGIAKGILEHLGIDYMPKPKEDKPMSDNKDTVSSWAKDAMEWAVKLGLTDGTNPKEPLTLERFTTILYRYDNSRK